LTPRSLDVRHGVLPFATSYGGGVGTVPDLDLAKIKRFRTERTPAHLRNQMRVQVGVRGKSVTISDCREPSDDLKDWFRMPIGQLRYDSTTTRWTLYWADRNDRWHLYDLIEPGRVELLLTAIEDDPTCIFWG
jgi:hypothetical protein